MSTLEKPQQSSEHHFTRKEHISDLPFQPQHVKPVLIAGWNQEALNLFDKIEEYPALGYDVKGFITTGSHEEGATYGQVPLLGDLNTLEMWLHFFEIDHVLITIHPDKTEDLAAITATCRAAGVRYSIVSDVYETAYGSLISSIYKDLFVRKEFGFRRTFDFMAALIMLIMFLPLFFLSAIIIKLESKGAVIYSQIRTGKDGRPFRIYKFRSMVQNAENETGPVWAKKKDPRITRFGNLMRLTRIDELPQLLNILKGDMGFIGPRPERPFFVESFKSQIPLYANRLQVKPGVTGWAQVKWHYDTTIEDVKEKLMYDLFYINHHNLWLDIKIFFLTIKTVLLYKGH